MSIQKARVALIGSGAISYTYLQNMSKQFDILEVVGCSDLIPERSRKRAEQFGIRQMTNEEIYADPEIEIVMNTTYPLSHYEVTHAALSAGKHVHSEKMLAANFTEAAKLAELANANGLRLGAAPDTFLGAGYQTCRKLIEDGYIGRPISAQALLVRGYHYSFAQNPEQIPFVFDAGGTIAYDMGGYYIHALVSLMGPIESVSGFAVPDPEKIYSHPFHPRHGEKLNLQWPTQVHGALKFVNGVMGTLVVLGEGMGEEVPRVEIYGTEGTLICPDPNTYGGPVLLMRKGNPGSFKMPLTHGNVISDRGDAAPPSAAPGEEANWYYSRRGIGVADMAWALRNHRPHRCSAELGVHAMEVIHGLEQSAATGMTYRMTSRPAHPEPLPAGYTGADHEASLAL